MSETIHTSDYRGKNYHVVRREDTISIDVTYPGLNEGAVQHIEINQESVRASDGIRLTYDFTRDGWSIQQPKLTHTLAKVVDGCAHYDSHEEWIETAFVESWALEGPDDWMGDEQEKKDA